MEYDHEKVANAALALLFLIMHNDGYTQRARKGMDWDVLERRHKKGFIADPKGKARSVVFAEAGAQRREEHFCQLFATRPHPDKQ